MKLGLCLSGGGIKGVAHIGAIKALEEENIKFEAVAGTSSGSIVSTLYACGYTSDEMYALFRKHAKEVKNIDWKNILKMVTNLITKRRLMIKGINSGEILEKIINKVCNEKGYYNIDELKKELLIPAVDYKTGKVFIFNSCNIDKENEYEKYISDAPIRRSSKSKL